MFESCNVRPQICNNAVGLEIASQIHVAFVLLPLAFSKFCI